MAIVHATTETFDTEIQNAQTPVIVDFWATWCGPCKMLAPVLDEIDAEHADNIKICKVNVDEQPALAAKFGIMSIPTLIFFRNGEEIGKLVGVHSKENILAIVQ